MPLFLIEGPTEEPLTLEQIKAQCQIEEPVLSLEPQLEAIGMAVRERAEIATGRQLVTATWELQLEGFPCERWIELPKAPLLGITHVKYVDTAGDLQTWDTDEWTHQAPTGPRARRGRLAPVYGYTWPAARCQFDAVQIRFTAGYGATGASVPALLKQAMLMDARTLWDHKKDVITGTMVTPLPRASAVIYRSFRSHATQRLAV